MALKTTRLTVSIRFFPKLEGSPYYRKKRLPVWERSPRLTKGHEVKRRTAIPQPVTAYVVENGFGGGEWLTFSVGENPSKGMNYGYIQHKDSYVGQTTLIRRTDVLKLIRAQFGDYHAYDWPKSS